MGAQVAMPDRQVVCIAGDASILMNIQELGTLAAYGLPVKVVIVNNHWQGNGASVAGKLLRRALFRLRHAQWHA